MNCPVCKNEKVGEDASHCPECSSDLTAFTLINEASNEKSSLKKVVMTLAAVAVVTIGGWGYTYMDGSAKARPTADQAVEATNTGSAEIDGLKTAIKAKDTEIEGLKAKLSELEATIESSEADVKETDAEGSHTVHIVKEGESLWSISKLYHGHGFKHLHIAGHNDLHHDPNHIEVGDTLIIKD